jgi:hypothetical protein
MAMQPSPEGGQLRVSTSAVAGVVWGRDNGVHVCPMSVVDSITG